MVSIPYTGQIEPGQWIETRDEAGETLGYLHVASVTRDESGQAVSVEVDDKVDSEAIA
jgi:hypothetical protein